jgi:hypothetical protein
MRKPGIARLHTATASRCQQCSFWGLSNGNLRNVHATVTGLITQQTRFPGDHVEVFVD